MMRWNEFLMFLTKMFLNNENRIIIDEKIKKKKKKLTISIKYKYARIFNLNNVNTLKKRI